jgi:hypothetical protein
MRSVAINFDDQPRHRPEEIDCVGTDPDVDPGLGKAVAPAEGQEARLQLASSVVGVELLVDGKTEELGLSKSRGELRLGKGAAEVTEGSGGFRHRDVLVTGDLIVGEGPRAVQHDPRSATTACHTSNQYVGRGWGRVCLRAEDSPQKAGAHVAKHGPWATRQHGRHPTSLSAQAAMADCIDTTMKTVKTSCRNSCSARVVADPSAVKLLG